MDVKGPGSGMADHNLWANMDLLTSRDEVKFVVADRLDFTYALEVIQDFRLAGRLPVLISPVFGQVTLKDAADWILATGLPLRLNPQLHKYIWGPEARGK
jgi:7-carboxy-7-deazaguanine synthase